MADTDAALEIALGLIRSDLDKIAAAVKEESRVMEMGESIAVVRYAGALVDVQKAEIAAARAADKEAADLTPVELLQRLAGLPGVRDALDRARADDIPASSKGRHDTDGDTRKTRGRRGE